MKASLICSAIVASTMLLQVSNAQSVKQPSLQETLEWLVGKLNTYSKDGVSIDNYSEEPHWGTNSDGYEIIIFKIKTYYKKPTFSYNLSSGTISMIESYTKSYLTRQIYKYDYNKLSDDQKAELEDKATWDDNFPRSKTTVLPFNFLISADFTAGSQVLSFYTRGDVVRNSDGDSGNTMELYFEPTLETNLLSRINKAIDNIKTLTKSSEAF